MSNKIQFLSVVDDEPDIMCLFKDALSQIGEGRVFGFTNSTLALEHFKLNHESYSLILSDYRMPVMDGILLLREVKSINSEVNTLLISAFDVDDKLFEECDSIDKFIQKPISIADLINEVEVLLSNRYHCLTH